MDIKEYLTENQQKATAFFQANLEKWAANPLYKMKYVVILNDKIAGFFDTFSNAICDAAAKYPQGDFIIQQIINDEEIINFLYPDISV